MKANKLFIFLIMINTVTNTFSQGTGQLPRTIGYKLDLRIDYDNDKLYGKCDITISNETNKPIEKIPVLLYRLLSVKSIENEKGIPLSFVQKITNITGWEKLQVNYIEILLNETLPPGKQRIIKIVYEGYLLGYSEEGWRYVKDHIDKDFTIIRTDGFDYPVPGYPNDQEMMAITREQYDYSIKISVPNGITAVSGGELVNRTSTDGETTFYFQSKKPSWRLDIALADYKFLENGKNRIYYFKRDSTRARSIMNDFETSLKLYTNMYGELKNFQGFSIIEVPEGYGSQADVTSILMTADNFEKQDELLTLYHEASHFWNVKPLDAVPCRFESEGLARFSEFLLSEKLNHKENAIQIAAQSNLDQTRKDFLEKPEYQNVPLKDYGIRDMTYYSYNLGMVVFAIYYKLVGQDCFSKTIRSFYSNYYSKGATLDEFINHCKKSASVDLERFFNDWIYTTNAIKLLADGKTFKEFIQYYKGN